MNCTDPVRADLARLAAGDLDAESSGRALTHAEQCPECSRELDFLADLLIAVHALPATRRTSNRTWIYWAAGLAAAATLVIFLARGRNAESRDGFTIDRSIPLFVDGDLRDASEPLKRDFATAMEPYSRRDFTGAIASLTAFLAQHADHGPARFYRGIAALETGDRARAGDDFAAVAASATGYLHEHALWRLANVRLAEARRAEALAILEGLRDAHGEFAANADAALERLRLRD